LQMWRGEEKKIKKNKPPKSKKFLNVFLGGEIFCPPPPPPHKSL